MVCFDKRDRQLSPGPVVHRSRHERPTLVVESYRAVGLGTEVSGNSVETAVRYTAWWCAVIGGNIAS